LPKPVHIAERTLPHPSHVNTPRAPQVPQPAASVSPRAGSRLPLPPHACQSQRFGARLPHLRRFPVSPRWARAVFFPGLWSFPAAAAYGPGLPGSVLLPPRLARLAAVNGLRSWPEARRQTALRGGALRARCPLPSLPRHPQGPLTLHHLLRLLLPRAALRRHIGCSSFFRNLSPQGPGPISAPGPEPASQ
jgi:hypothetical protein